MRGVFDKLAESLKIGETGIIISHGDPIALLFNDIIKRHLPEPQDLRGSMYPEKGVGTVIVLDSNNEITDNYKLNPQDAGSKW